MIFCDLIINQNKELLPNNWHTDLTLESERSFSCGESNGTIKYLSDYFSPSDSPLKFSEATLSAPNRIFGLDMEPASNHFIAD